MSATLGEILAAAARELSPVTDTPRLDAEILLAHALDITRAKLLARQRDVVDVPGFEKLLERRLNHEPIAYILGEWEFYSLDLEIYAPILVPRPETEHVVECVLEHIDQRPARVLDLCTGSGCIAVAIAVNAPKAEVIATDLNPAAAELATRNARRHGVAGRVVVLQGDLFDALPAHAGPFDAIASNPPYVEEGEWGSLPEVIRKHEDPEALLSGPEGLDHIRRIVSGAQACLVPGGLLAIEIGMGQDEAVGNLLKQNGYEDLMFKRDLAGIRRVAVGKRPAA